MANKKSDWNIELQNLDKNSLNSNIKTAIQASVRAAGLLVTFIAPLTIKKHKKSENFEDLDDGFRDGHSGYGFYFGDIRQDDKKR
jgi:hypothetical protein